MCEQYSKDKEVIPASLKNNAFTLAAIDNIDFNPSSTTATSSFHGTSISYHQHTDDKFTDRPPFVFSDQNYAINLPDSFSIVLSLNVNVNRVEAPQKRVYYPHFDGREEMEKENQLLCDSRAMLSLPFSEHHKIGWAGYYEQKVEGTEIKPCVTGLVPMFDEKAASAAMMKHGMSVIASTIEKINPGQNPIICGDQPLYALMNSTVQWKYPQVHGEDRMIIMLGGSPLRNVPLDSSGKVVTKFWLGCFNHCSQCDHSKSS